MKTIVHNTVRFIAIILMIGVTTLLTISESKQTMVVVHAVTQSEIKQLEQELANAKANRDKVNSQLDAEKKNEQKLNNDKQYIENVLTQSELQTQQVQSEISIVELEIKKLKTEREQLENNITDLEKKISDLNDEMLRTTNLFYKVALGSPTLLDKNSDFENSVINEEKMNSMVQLIKISITEIKDLKIEVTQKKEAVLANENEQIAKQDVLKAQENNLKLQQESLEWQKSNKERLAEQAKQNQSLLAMDKQAANQKVLEVEKKLSELRSKALSLPASGTPVKAGQVIGQQGATGFVTGSHLHFEYKLSAGGDRVNPEAYRNTFTSQPMDKMTLTSGYGNRCFPYNGKQYCDFHTGADYVNFDGAPIYAVKSGKVDYYCDSYGGLGAIVFHDDGSRSLYWHMKKVPGCKALAGY